MKFVAFSGLPFHRWCLEDVVKSARSRGHEVVDVGHRPTHAHDWWTGSAETCSALADAAANADFVVVADYPYAQLRNGLRLGTKIVSVRHSLASRGNTYQLEQADADVLPLFSEYDRDRLDSAKLLPKIGSLRSAPGTGCPWAGPMFVEKLSGDRMRLLDRLGIDRTDERPIVAVATTWNEWTSLDVVRALAADGSRIVVWRPHWAASWRRPGEADLVRSFGAYVDDPLAHPAGLLLAADILVGDVSGIVLLATLVRSGKGARFGRIVEGALPIVQIDPDLAALSSSGQLDIGGPEWTFRKATGPRVSAARAAERIADAVDSLLVDDPWRASRATVGQTLAGTYTDGTSADRLVQRLESS